MAITTLDGVIAGAQPPEFFQKAVSGTLVAGRPHSFWPIGGKPGAGGQNGTLAGATLTSPVAGQIPFSNPGVGLNAYLSRFLGSALQPGTLILADRLWSNGGFTITSATAQTVNSVAWPARDHDGSTNGRGVLLGVEVSGATGAGTPTITVSYTESQVPTAGRTGTNSVATVASSIVGTFYPIGLQAGDVGVRSVQTLTLSATWTSGTINLVAYRPIASIPIVGAGIPGIVDAITGNMPRLYNGTVPFLIFIPSTTTTTTVQGDVGFTHG